MNRLNPEPSKIRTQWESMAKSRRHRPLIPSPDVRVEADRTIVRISRRHRRVALVNVCILGIPLLGLGAIWLLGNDPLLFGLRGAAMLTGALFMAAVGASWAVWGLRIGWIQADSATRTVSIAWGIWPIYRRTLRLPASWLRVELRLGPVSEDLSRSTTAQLSIGRRNGFWPELIIVNSVGRSTILPAFQALAAAGADARDSSVGALAAFHLPRQMSVRVQLTGVPLSGTPMGLVFPTPYKAVFRQYLPLRVLYIVGALVSAAIAVAAPHVADSKKGPPSQGLVWFMQAFACAMASGSVCGAVGALSSYRRAVVDGRSRTVTISRGWPFLGADEVIRSEELASVQVTSAERLPGLALFCTLSLVRRDPSLEPIVLTTTLRSTRGLASAAYIAALLRIPLLKPWLVPALPKGR